MVVILTIIIFIAVIIVLAWFTIVAEQVLYFFTGLSMGDPAQFVIQSSPIQTIFWLFFLLAFGLSIIFSMIGIVRSIFNTKIKISKILGRWFMSIFGCLVAVAAIYLIVEFGNSLLRIIASILDDGRGGSLFSRLIMAFTIKGSDYEKYISQVIENGVFNNPELLESVSYFTSVIFGEKILFKFFGLEILTGYEMFTPFMNGMNLIAFLIALFSLALTIFFMMIKLAKRVFNMAMLFVVLPFTWSTFAVDEGKRVKKWMEEMAKEYLVIFAVVLVYHLYFIVLSALLSMSQEVFVVLLCVLGGSGFINSGVNIFLRVFTESRGGVHTGSGAVLLGAGSSMATQLAFRGGLGGAGSVGNAAANAANGNPQGPANEGYAARTVAGEGIGHMFSRISSRAPKAAVRGGLTSKAYNVGAHIGDGLAKVSGIGIGTTLGMVGGMGNGYHDED